MTGISIGSKQFTFLDIAVFTAVIAFIGIIALVILVNYGDEQAGPTASPNPMAAQEQDTDSGTKEVVNYKPPQRVKIPVQQQGTKIPGKEKSINPNITYVGKLDKQYGTSVSDHQRKMISELKKEAADGGPGALTEEQIEQLKKDGNMIY